MSEPGNPDVPELVLPGAETACSYLPNQIARMEYRVAPSLSTERYELLLAHGWRRFGRTLFRPACPRCRECRSLRVILAEFTPSRSQRRCLRRNTDVRFVVQRPTLTSEHLRVHNAWHREMQRHRGWPFRETSADDYFQSFLDGDFEFSREFLYLQDDRLVGIGHVDLTDHVQSSIYFVHDPQWRSDGPGTYSALCEIQHGRTAQRQHMYLGYYIRDCGSMNYKNRFLPHEILRDYVSDTVTPVWERPMDHGQL